MLVFAFGEFVTCHKFGYRGTCIRKISLWWIVLNDQLYSPSLEVDNAQQHKKITTYYNIYKIHSPHSYTVTKTCLVFFLIKQLGSSIPKITATFLNNTCYQF